MATITALGNPVTVTAPDNGENILVFHTNFNRTLKDVNTATVTLKTGTVNLNTCGQAAANGAQLATADEKLVFSFDNVNGISFKCAAAGNTFIVTF